MYELTIANRNSPSFWASNVDNLNSVGLDHFINLEGIAGTVGGTGSNGATPDGE
ncbi:hypothetical protein [Roseobacter sp.]|uniref:hypothetical protein n=1 Tax=Roseobacter sp. TaxID=1907202 RepID=UPI003859A63D